MTRFHLYYSDARDELTCRSLVEPQKKKSWRRAVSIFEGRKSSWREGSAA